MSTNFQEFTVSVPASWHRFSPAVERYSNEEEISKYEAGNRSTSTFEGYKVENSGEVALKKMN